MSYDIGGGYDAWKTATPWDDEVSLTVSFECGKCEAEIEGLEATGGRGSDEVIVECPDCGAENTVDVGE